MLNNRPEDHAARFEPVAPAARVDALDVARGAAILGVLVAYTVWNLGGPPEETFGSFDRILSFLLDAFLNTKAYSLLAFLFGLGFSMQLIRASERGVNIVPPYCRRLLGLMLIGLAHSLLLRNGDILVPYAAVGFVLLLFRNASNIALLAGAIFGAALPFIARSLWDASGVPFPSRPETEGMGHLAANLAWVKYWYSTAITFWPEILPMFLFGLFVGRKRILEKAEAHKKALRFVLVAGLAIGSIIYIARLVVIETIGWPKSPTDPVSMVLRFSWNVHAWGFAAFYGASIALLMQKGRVQALSTPLAALGRMALTNYLLQAMIIVPICVVFDLYDRVTPTGGLLLALLVAAIQIPFSVIWLKYFRFGPAEWLLRSITYKKLHPIKIAGQRHELETGAIISR